jgi:VanZ family protein
MSVITQSPDASTRTLRVVVWWIAVGLWTAALVTSYPAQLSHDVLAKSMQLPTAKMLHVVAYGGLTALIPWLGLPLGWRWVFLAFLSLHTVGTEYVQIFVPLRTGSATDVLIDHGGILLGVLITWKGWRRSRPVD